MVMMVLINDLYILNHLNHHVIVYFNPLYQMICLNSYYHNIASIISYMAYHHI